MTKIKQTDYQQIIKIAKICMILAGFWKRPISTNELHLKLYYVYCIFMQGAFLFLWILLVIEFLRLSVMGYDSLIVLSSLGVAVDCAKIVSKIILFQKNNILDLYEDVIANEEEIWTSEDADIKNNYTKYVALSRRLTSCQIFITTTGVTTFGVMGVVGDQQLIEYNAANNASLETHYLYQFWFPGNKLDHLVWVDFLNVIFIYNSILYNSITHMIVVTLFVFTASQLNVLKIRISRFETAGKDLQNSEKISLLKELIAKHMHIIRFTETLNKATRNVLLIEFLLSSVDISSIAVNVAKETSLQTIWHFFFFSVLFFQVMVMSWTANEIKLQSIAIADALYETDWYTLDKEGARLIHIMIMRAQRPLVLTIGPLGPMTLEAGLKILKAAYSYVSVMKDTV